MRNVLKVVVVNFGMVLVLVGLLSVGPIVLVKAYDLYRAVRPIPTEDHRQHLPLYEGVDWASGYFTDQREIVVEYADFTVWQFAELETETINIGPDGSRVSVSAPVGATDELWMFGGSTVYGTGVDDAHTIPSLLSTLLGAEATNHGQDNFVARQSLIRLHREYEGADQSVGRRTVVFYDGVNDVHVKCRVENEEMSTDRQTRIRAALDRASSDDDLSPAMLLRPMSALLDKVTERIGASDPGDLYVCDEDGERAHRVARALVSDWLAARSVVEGRGDRFLAVLQPISYLGESRLDHLRGLELDNELTKQYEVLYPLIRGRAEEQGLDLLDLSDVLDPHPDLYLYIDFCHLGPRGNQLVAEAIAGALA